MRFALKAITLILLASLILTALPIQICLCKSPSASIIAHHKVKREFCKVRAERKYIGSVIITLAENEDGNFNISVQTFRAHASKNSVRFDAKILDPPGGTVGPI
ncbi:hypothetical protein J7L18_05045 [Candidatus Bathyarchaeota archaeon]|nr:hypothetical protein [Candidatus Bathyarchaeota archaeon]